MNAFGPDLFVSESHIQFANFLVTKSKQQRMSLIHWVCRLPRSIIQKFLPRSGRTATFRPADMPTTGLSESKRTQRSAKRRRAIRSSNDPTPLNEHFYY